MHSLSCVASRLQCGDRRSALRRAPRAIAKAFCTATATAAAICIIAAVSAIADAASDPCHRLRHRHLPPPEAHHRRPLDSMSHHRWRQFQRQWCCLWMLSDPPLPSASPPAFCGRFTRLEKDQRDPFERRTCLPSHRGSIGRRLRRLYISYGSSRATPAALGGLSRGRSAGRGCGQRPLTSCIHAAAFMHVPHRAVTLSLSL